MKKPAQLSAFDASEAAFWIRFERELTSRWEKLEHKTEMDMIRNPSSKKYSLLIRFFDDAQEQLAGAIHTYFPKMLEVATTGRQHIGNQAPLAWTQAHVWTEICNFLGMDEQFEHTSAPREDSRVWRTALRISTDAGNETHSQSLLPAWVEPRRAVIRQFGRDAELSEADTEPLSFANTEKWVKWREDLMYTRLEKQIDNDKLDGIIEAGEAGISVLDPLGVDSPKTNPKAPERGALRTSPTIAKRSDKTSFRMGVIFKAIESGKKGLDYCAFLRDNGLKTPESWGLTGYGHSYSLAYLEVKQKGREYRGRIHKEKSRHSVLYSNLRRDNPAELRRVLAIANRTPRP
jgi:hypothetical protein